VPRRPMPVARRRFRRSVLARTATAALLAALALAGCVRTSPRAERWDVRWASLEASGPRWRPGEEFTLASYEPGPAGVRVTRRTWVLLGRDGGEGTFELRGAGGSDTVVRLPFHADVPTRPHAGVAPGRSTYPYAGGLVHVTVPAGRFRCARTWRQAVAPDGTPLRVDEWWAIGVPFPVQRWTRRESRAEALDAPPRRPADLRAGTEWMVLERLSRP
jgi:hypothetical protein